MTASVFASVSEDRVADAKGIEALINKYLVAVKRCDVESLRSTFEPSANISHYYVKGDAIRVNDVEGFINVIKSLHAKYDKPRKWRKRSTFAAIGSRTRKGCSLISSQTALRVKGHLGQALRRRKRSPLFCSLLFPNARPDRLLIQRNDRLRAIERFVEVAGDKSVNDASIT
jgi:Putative lumazine-binding